jgi:hypothetical protein
VCARPRTPRSALTPAQNFSILWKPDAGVTVVFRVVHEHAPEMEAIPLSTASKDALIESLLQELGWRHTTSDTTAHISAIHFVPTRAVDQEVCERLRQSDTILDVRCRKDAWTVMWIEKGDEKVSYRAMKRQHPEYFVPRAVRRGAGKSARSRFRPSEHAVPNVLNDLYHMIGLK